MKPENAHIISLCGHLGPLLFFLGVQGGSLCAGNTDGSLSLYLGCKRRNTTQLWACHLRDPDTASGSEGKLAWPLCYSRWMSPPLLTWRPPGQAERAYKIRPSGGMQPLPLPRLSQPRREGCFCQRRCSRKAFSAWNLMTQKHCPVNHCLETCPSQRPT